MKILISTDFYTHNLGGVTTSVIGLSAGLRSLGHEVRILTLSGNNTSTHEGDVYSIRSFSAEYSPDMRMSLAISDPLLKELSEWHPDIIHVQSEGSALLFARRIQRHCHIPLIMTCHTDYAYFVFGENRDKALAKAIAIVSAVAIYVRAEKILVPSKKALRFPFLQTFKDRLLVLPNGIELEKHDQHLSDPEREELRSLLGIRKDKKVLVAITRLSKEKNIEELIEFFPALLKKVPEALLLIVGSGPDEDNLKNLAVKNKLQGKVLFAGRVPADKVWRYYAIGDLFVSASMFELHSMSYLEALAQSLPLVCHEDEALDGVLIDGYNGFVYNTCEEFTDSIARILHNDELRKKMADASYANAKEFSSESFASNALKIYQDVIEEWNRGHNK